MNRLFLVCALLGLCVVGCSKASNTANQPVTLPANHSAEGPLGTFKGSANDLLPKEFAGQRVIVRAVL